MNDSNCCPFCSECPCVCAQNLERDINELASAAHNFYVTVKPWMHHLSDMLVATEKDLMHVLGKHINDIRYAKVVIRT